MDPTPNIHLFILGGMLNSSCIYSPCQAYNRWGKNEKIKTVFHVNMSRGNRVGLQENKVHKPHG